MRVGSRELELVLTRETAGRLLELEGQGRPAFVRLTRVEGQTKVRRIARVIEEYGPAEDQMGWIEVRSAREFLDHFDIVKIYSARGIRIIRARRERLDRTYRATFRRLLYTYGWGDPISQITACVVGLGRLGSKVALALSEQGVRRFILIDPQAVEKANQQLALYRAAGIGTPKVEVVKKALGEDAEVVAIPKALWDLNAEELALVTDADVMFVCVDNVLTRAMACALAMRLGIPMFEAGVQIVANPNHPPMLLGRIQTALPGNWCHFCVSGAFDQGQAAQEMLEVEMRGKLASPAGPADPTLSECVGATMVLAFRLALEGGGINPRYLLQFGDPRRLGELRVDMSGASPGGACRLCRPPYVPPPDAQVQISSSGRPGWEKRAVWNFLEKLWIWVGTAAAGIVTGVGALTLAFALLLAIKYMIGFQDDYGRMPNLFHFLAHFDSWRYDHGAGHYFALIPSALILVGLPYLVFGLPLAGMRWAHRALQRPLVRKQARRPMLEGLEELQRRWPVSLPFRVPIKVQRVLQRTAQGLAILTEIAALALLFPLFKAWGGQVWLVLTFSCFLPLWLAFGIIWGAMSNHRLIARFITWFGHRR